MAMYETPQVAPSGLATQKVGGEAPDAEDVKKSANARGGKRHDMHGKRKYADEGYLPSVSGPELDKAGMNNTGYLVKKGTPYGVNAFFNTLPPGMDIDDQETIDSRQMELRTWGSGLSYPGDGW